MVGYCHGPFSTVHYLLKASVTDIQHYQINNNEDPKKRARHNTAKQYKRLWKDWKCNVRGCFICDMRHVLALL